MKDNLSHYCFGFNSFVWWTPWISASRQLASLWYHSGMKPCNCKCHGATRRPRRPSETLWDLTTVRQGGRLTDDGFYAAGLTGNVCGQICGPWYSNCWQNYFNIYYSYMSSFIMSFIPTGMSFIPVSTGIDFPIWIRKCNEYFKNNSKNSMQQKSSPYTFILSTIFERSY